MLDFFTTKDREKILEKAVKLKAEGRLDQAIKTLESSAGDAPEDFDLMMELGRDYFELGRRIDAVSALRKAYTLDSQRTDEVVGALTDLHYRASSPIETGDALVEIFTMRREFEELERILKSLSSRDLQLLETRYLKIFENNVRSKSPGQYSSRDMNIVIQLASAEIIMGRAERGFEVAEVLLDVREQDRLAVSNWAKSVGRWKWGDPKPQFFLVKVLLRNQKFDEALNIAQRTIEFDKTYSLRIIEAFSKVTLPANIQVDFLSFTSALEVGIKDIDKAIANLNRLLELDKTKIEDVIKGLRELLRLSPKEQKIIFALGDVYLRANRTGLAIDEYNKVLEIAPGMGDVVLERFHKVFKADPKNPQVIQALVEAYLLKDDPVKATDIIEQCFQADPGLADEYVINLNLILEKDINNIRALNLLGLAYFKKGEIDNALVVFESLLSQDPEAVAMAEAGARSILKTDAKNLTALKLLIDAQTNQGRAAESLALIQERIKADPVRGMELVPKIDEMMKRDPGLVEPGRSIYLQLKGQDEFMMNLAVGRSYGYEKKFDRAIEYFQKTIGLDPGRSEIVKKAMVELIQTDPKAVPLLVYIARVYLKDGDIEKSARFFRAAQAADPSIFSEIIDDFYDIVKAHPEDVSMRRLLVDSLFNKGLYDRTAEECRITTEAVQGKDAAYFYLKQAQALLAKGKLSDAVRPFMLAQESDINYTNDVVTGLEKILSIDKSNVPAHFALGRAYGAARMVNRAVEELLLTARIVPTRVNYVIEELKRLEELAPANALVHFAQGILLVGQKKYEDGVRELDQAREMDKNLLDRIIPLFEKIGQEHAFPELYLSQARAYSDKSTYQLAVEYFQRAFESEPGLLEQIISGLKVICTSQPDIADARRLLARIYFDYNALDDAIEVAREMYKHNAAHRSWSIDFAQEVLNKNKEHIPTHYFLSELCFEELKFAKAVETLEQLKGFAPQEIPEMINRAEKIQEQNQYVPELLIFLTDRYIDVAREEKAVVFLRQLYNSNASFADAVLMRLRNILKKKPDIMDAYFLTADILTAQKDYRRAREALEFGEKYATDMKDKVELRLRMANLFNVLGDFAGASNALMKALRVSHNKKSVYNMIRDLHHTTLVNRLEIARREDSEESRLEQARLFVALGDMVEAEKVLYFIPSSLETKKAQALIRARILLAKNQALDALELLRYYKDDERIILTTVDVYEKIGNFAAAIAALKNLGRQEFGPRIKMNETRLIESILAGKKRILEGRR